MSDEATLTPTTAPAAGGGTSKAVMGLLVLNLAVTGLVAFKTMTAHPPAAAAHHAKEEPTSEITGPVVPLDVFVVNLDEPGTSRYLKVSLELELKKGAEEALNKSKQLVRDAILSYLSGLHLKDTLGAGAKDKIRTDLMAAITKLMGPDKVRRMFFNDFVVQ